MAPIWTLPSREDQLCYQFSPENITKDVRHGIHLIVDENKDRTLETGSSSGMDQDDHDKDQFHTEDESVKVYLDAIGKSLLKTYFIPKEKII